MCGNFGKKTTYFSFLNLASCKFQLIGENVRLDFVWLIAYWISKGERANTVILSEHMREGNAKMCGKSGYRHLSVDFSRDLPATNLRA